MEFLSLTTNRVWAKSLKINSCIKQTQTRSSWVPGIASSRDKQMKLTPFSRGAHCSAVGQMGTNLPPPRREVCTKLRMTSRDPVKEMIGHGVLKGKGCAARPPCLDQSHPFPFLFIHLVINHRPKMGKH